MSEPYQEIIDGQPLLRPPPGEQHEAICSRLHERVLPVLAGLTQFSILGPREQVVVSRGNLFRPDLTIVESATGRPWLVVEVVDFADHMPDTVAKKDVFSDVRLPRLWLVDPRYGNVEVHHGSAFGIVLKSILGGREVLEEGELPGLKLAVKDLFSGGGGGGVGR